MNPMVEALAARRAGAPVFVKDNAGGLDWPREFPELEEVED